MGSIKQTISTTETKDKYGNVIAIEANTKTVSIGKSAEPNYCKIYTNQLTLLNTVKDSSLRLLLFLLPYVSYADVTDRCGGQLIKLDKATKEEIAEKMNMSRSTFFRALSDLTENNIIKKIDSINFQLNPNLFGCGFWLYKENYHSGGIGDLKNEWNNEDGKKIVETRHVTEDSAYVKFTLKEELKKAYKDFKAAVRKKDVDEADYYKKMINKYTRSIKELDEEEYTKVVKYTVEVNNFDIENLDADIDENQEPQEIEVVSNDLTPPAGFGAPEDDPFLLFTENSV